MQRQGGIQERARPWPARGARTRQILLTGALLVGLASRIVWCLRRGGVEGGEAQAVAVALASGRGFADAYFVGAGPTAHMMPVSPLLAGAVYAVAGIKTLAAEAILQTLSFVEIGIAYVLLDRLFGRLGMSVYARTAAIVFLACVPMFIGQETGALRCWESGLAIDAGLAAVNHAADLSLTRRRLTARVVATIAMLFAVAFLISPAVGLAAGAAYGIVVVRRYPVRAWLPVPLAALAAAGILLAPWALRNQAVMGRTIWLRSNGGLELAIANNDLVARSNSLEAVQTYMARVHPRSPDTQAEVRRVGELAYLDRVGAEVKGWIAAHPRDFAALCLRHLRQIFFPDAWEFALGSGTATGARAAIAGLLSVLAIAGWVWRLRGNASLGWTAVEVYVLVIALTYVPFQPVVRYLYLLHGVFVFGAIDLLDRLIRRLRGRAPLEGSFAHAS